MLYDSEARLTIPIQPPSTASTAGREDPEALSLAALGWILADSRRAERFLALTGLTPDVLRGGLGDRAVLRAILEFLGGHEPDLMAAAEALGIEPQALTNAMERLGS